MNVGRIAKKIMGLAGLSLLALVVIGVQPKSAWADTVATFTVASGPTDGIFAGSGYSFGSGSEITIDTTKGIVENADIIVDNSSKSPVATFTGTPDLVNSPLGYVWYSGASDFLVSALPSTFLNFTGCQDCSGLFFQLPTLLTGTVSLTELPVSAAEPGSALLLAGGMIALIGLSLRRKQFA